MHFQAVSCFLIKQRQTRELECGSRVLNAYGMWLVCMFSFYWVFVIVVNELNICDMIEENRIFLYRRHFLEMFYWVEFLFSADASVCLFFIFFLCFYKLFVLPFLLFSNSLLYFYLLTFIRLLSNKASFEWFFHNIMFFKYLSVGLIIFYIFALEIYERESIFLLVYSLSNWIERVACLTECKIPPNMKTKNIPKIQLMTIFVWLTKMEGNPPPMTLINRKLIIKKITK